MPDCCACRKIFVSRTTGSVPAAIRSRSTSPAPTEGSWSTSPTSSRCAPGGDGLDELVREDHVDHRGLVDHDQVRVQRVVGVEGRVAAGLQLEQPVDGRGLVAGQLGEPLGGAAGRGGQHDLRVPGARELDHGADGEALAAAGAAGQHRDLARSAPASPRRPARGEVGAGRAFSQPKALSQSTAWNAARRSAPAERRRQEGSRQGPFGMVEGRQVDGLHRAGCLSRGRGPHRGRRAPSAARSAMSGAIRSAGTSRILAASATRTCSGR